MKKFLLPILSAVLLFGCTESGTNQKVYPKSVMESQWGLTNAKKMYDTFSTVVPYIASDSYEIEYSIDDYGDPLVSMYLYYSTDEAANQGVETFAQALADIGYTVELTTDVYIDWDTYTYIEYEVAYGDKVIGTNLGMEYQFLASEKNNKPCLGIFGYNYVYSPKDVFPTVAVEKILGKKASKIPTVEGEGYEYSFMFNVDKDNGAMGLEIVIKNTMYTIEQEYFAKVARAAKMGQTMYDDYDEDFAQAVMTYPGYEDQYYYGASIADDIMIFYDYNLSKASFVIDIWTF